MMRPVKPGDLLVMCPQIDMTLVGVVLSHHDDVQEVTHAHSWLHQDLAGPGVSIYWQPSGVVALWTYCRITEEIVAGRIKQVNADEP